MTQSMNILRAFGTTLALALVAGCVASPPPQAAATNGPELAGAWYQVYFDSDKSDVNSKGQSIVASVAYVVANNATTRVTVIGKTDRVGTPSANMTLSQRRADKVRDALIGAGVPAGRIDTGWTGEYAQAVTTANDAAERRNRVVDITVIKQ